MAYDSLHPMRGWRQTKQMQARHCDGSHMPQYGHTPNKRVLK